MSKIEQLLKELCPNGVEYKKLGEIATIERGNGLQKKDFVPAGVPCIHYGQLYTRFKTFTKTALTFVDNVTASNLKHLVQGDILMAVTSENVEDVCKCIAWLGDKDVVVGGHTAIIHHKQNPMYLAYWFQTEDFFSQKRKLAHGTKVIEVTPKKLEDVVIPVPPLEVQREVVEVLDKFALLTAELEKRKKQYEHYRDKLLKFTQGYKQLTVEEILKSLKTGLNPRQNFKLNTMTSTCPYITGKDVYGNKINVSDKTDLIDAEVVTLINKRACLETGDVLFASTGTGTVGRMAIVENYQNDWAVSETMYCMKVNRTMILPRYLMFVLTASDAKRQYEPKISKGSVPHLKVVDLLRVKLLLPPLAEQERIVKILDKFDKLCNDLTSGLPTEIAARKKQYEYYRDKLLTFKKAG